MENEKPKPKGGNSEALKRWHASRTPEQKAAWREKVAINTSIGMIAWNAGRTAGEKAVTSELIKASEICRTFTRRRTPRTVFKKGHRPVHNHPPASPALRELARVQKASIVRIIRDLVLDEPEKWREAIIRGRDARPPHSFPYVALAAAYLDGKPVNADPPIRSIRDLSELSAAELQDRAVALVNRLKSANEQRALPVIDVQIIPEDK